MKKLIVLLPTILLLLSAVWKPVLSPTNLYVIGDSTASAYDNGTYPRKGWGQVLQDFFNRDLVTVYDLARSGRSSKSYYHEAEGWPNVLNNLEAGDFLLIQFGHNDSKPDTARYTEPYSSYQEYLGRYIAEARALDVTPILLTSVHRNSWTADTLEITNSHGDYLDAARQLAEQENVPLIDMANLSETLFESLGYRYTTEEIFLNLPANIYTAYPEGNEDNTHFSETGAYELAKLVADNIVINEDSELDMLRDGLYPNMIKARLQVNPVAGGYIQGPRYMPEGVQRALFAKAADGYTFSNWEQDGDLISNQVVIPVTLNEVDHSAIIAVFASPTSTYAVRNELQLEVVQLGNSLLIKSPENLDQVQLFSGVGQLVHQQSDINALAYSLPTSGLPAAVYFLKANTATKGKTLQVVISK